MSSREEVATGQVERLLLALVLGFPGGSGIKNPPANAGGMSLIPGSGRSLEKEMARKGPSDDSESGIWTGTRRVERKPREEHPVFLPRKSHGQRSLAAYNPW